MKKLSFKFFFTELFIIFILSLTPLLWFKPGTILVGHDNTYPLEPKIFLKNRLSTWTENFFGIDQSLILGTIPIHAIDAIPSYLRFNLQDGQKIVYVFWFFLIGLSAYTLAWTLNPESSLFRLTTVVFYQFNYFILQGWWIGEKSKFSAYIALPLLLAVILRVTRRQIGILIGSMLVAFILFFFNAGGLYGIPLYGGAFVAIGILILLKIILFVRVRDFFSLYRLIIFSIFAVLFSVLINGYFLIPGYVKIYSGKAPNVNSVGGVSGIISWAKQISANASYFNLFRLQGIPEWYDNADHPYAKQILERRIFISISYLWPLMVFTSLFLAKKGKNVNIICYFFLVYLFGVLFTSGTHPPLGFLYEFFVKKIPGFVIFRSPYFKFAPALFLASGCLVAYFMDNLPKKIKPVAFGILMSVIFIYHYPYFTGNFFNWRNIFSTRLSIPNYVFQFGTWLNREKKDDDRVLLLPPNNPNNLYSTYEWGYLSFQALPTLLSDKSTIINNDQINPSESIILKKLYKAIEDKDYEIIKKLSSILDISYFLLQKDAINDPKSDVEVDISKFLSAVRSNTEFAHVRSFEKWDLFKLKDKFSPKIYIANRLTVISGGNEEFNSYIDFIDDKSVFFERGNQMQIKLSTTGDITPEIIVPTCLTCPVEEHPFISFPTRNISPVDPFYQLVIFLENRKKVSDEPKAAIYHFLGTSLKRLSEIKDLVISRGVLTADVVEKYIYLLQSVEKYFQKLDSLQEKIKLAQDISYYMKAERNLIESNLSQYIPSGEQTLLAGRIFAKISELEKLINLPELQLDELGNRVYQFSVTNQGKYELLLKTTEFKDAINMGVFSVVIDDAQKINIFVSKEMFDKPWVSFGFIDMLPGIHKLTVTFPRLLANVQTLIPVETEFSHDNTFCFGTQIKNLQNSKFHKLYINYINDFSPNLYLYIWNQQASKRILKNAITILPSSLMEKSENLIETPEGFNEALVALCAPDLTEEKIKKRFQISVSDILEPKIILNPQTIPPENSVPVIFEKISSTKYKIKLLTKSNNGQKTLIFTERYDSWWELSGVLSQHIKVNGYANGWIIDGVLPDEMEIIYKGEKYFFYGKLVTLFVASGISIYFLYRFLILKHHD